MATQRNPGQRPRSEDGREYPEHLEAYERLDESLIPIVRSHQPITFDELSAEVHDVRERAALPRWLASAQWRGVLRRETEAPGVRSYSLSERLGETR